MDCPRFVIYFRDGLTYAFHRNAGRVMRGDGGAVTSYVDQEMGVGMKDRLGAQHISALFALMGAAGEISNTELQELAGFRIEGQLRRTLNERHLVVSTRHGNTPFVHELTDAGWKRCEAELAGERPEGSGHVAGAFYMVLDGIGRFLQRENKILTHVFQPEAGRTP